MHANVIKSAGDARFPIPNRDPDSTASTLLYSTVLYCTVTIRAFASCCCQTPCSASNQSRDFQCSPLKITRTRDGMVLLGYYGSQYGRSKKSTREMYEASGDTLLWLGLLRCPLSEPRNQIIVSIKPSIAVGKRTRLTGKERVELLHLVRDAQVNGRVGKVNHETALDGGVDLLDNLERLAASLGGNLRALEGRLDARDSSLVERLLIEWSSVAVAKQRMPSLYLQQRSSQSPRPHHGRRS